MSENCLVAIANQSCSLITVHWHLTDAHLWSCNKFKGVLCFFLIIAYCWSLASNCFKHELKQQSLWNFKFQSQVYGEPGFNTQASTIQLKCLFKSLCPYFLLNVWNLKSILTLMARSVSSDFSSQVVHLIMMRLALMFKGKSSFIWKFGRSHHTIHRALKVGHYNRQHHRSFTLGLCNRLPVISPL